MLLITFLILGVLLKVYFFKDKVTWVQMSPISLAPFVLVYGWELFVEFLRTTSNYSSKRDHFTDMLVGQNQAEKGKAHTNSVLKVNFGLLPNFILISAYNYGFFFLLCLRLDQKIKLSYFIILIPVWILMLYFTIFTTVVGVASRNPRANTCEKVFVSLLVPTGFFTTLILAICYIEGYIKTKHIAYLFAPQLLGYLMLYLFVRCLVKPAPSFTRI